ncbi:Gfo/Idh/MocA family protein [Motilibacter aurantiacus]|uniref:Gfo/Idh/MocA family protein n=1 Tax=Motilibacter aurantiacus TaxID=2714955 RepID=UPI00140C01AE|nr:Gfo/Idh/MocA family oxidoreductase [Motilibacter aurantiacus]NHC45008.1 Gfo/Idh/MocA family oxidoreductase [Motilibacter aurantiacus]
MALRFGVVGTGHWARTTHGATLARLAREGRAELAGVWGRDPARTAAAASAVGTTAYPSFDALLDDVDAVTFAVPPTAQALLAERAAAAGRHLLLEKPVATDADAARRLEAAVTAAGVASAVFFTRRYDPATAAWVAAARATGGWTGGHGEWSARIEGGPYADSAWRKELGALWDVGPHALGLMLPLLGEVAAVTAVPGPGDTTHLVLRHRSGASSSATLSMTVPVPAKAQTLVAYGDNGRTAIPDVRFDTPECFANAVSALVRAAAGSEVEIPDVHFGRHVVEVLAAADLSRRSDRTVEVQMHAEGQAGDGRLEEVERRLAEMDARYGITPDVQTAIVPEEVADERRVLVEERRRLRGETVPGQA